MFATALIKVLVGIACLVASFWGLTHADVKNLKELFKGSSTHTQEQAHDIKLDWKMCTIAKGRCMKNGEKVLDGRCGSVWEECGKEIHEHEMKKAGVDVKDCFFDKECHAKVDWEKIGKIKEDFFAHLKVLKEKEKMKEIDDAAAVKLMMGRVHNMFREAGMPEDRVDYILIKWVKGVCPEFLREVEEEGTDWKICRIAKERCMKDGDKVFDGGCAMVWESCGEEVKARQKTEEDVNEWKICSIAKERCMKDGEKVFDGGCAMVWENCGEELKAHQKTEEDVKDWKKCSIATESCMKDGEKVLDVRCTMVWDKCEEEVKIHKKVKQNANHWKMCSIARESCWKDGKKVVDGRCRIIWHKCGEEVKAHNMEEKDSKVEKVDEFESEKEQVTIV